MIQFTIKDPRLWTYRAFVDLVVDGDTLQVVIDTGFQSFRRERIRLLGIDTPELRRGTEAGKEKAREARDRVIALVFEREVVIRTEKADSFGRWLATVELPDGRDLGRILIAEGLAKEYR